jgi:hypothetical protein
MEQPMMRALWFPLVLAACAGAGPAPDDTALDSSSDSGTDTPADTDSGTDTPEPQDTDTGDPPPLLLDGACPLAERVGGFVVDSTSDYAFVDGSVSDGVLPVSVLTPMEAEGDCTILRRENPFCDPGCGPSETCDLSGTCVPYPVTQDVGVVVVDGLSEPVSMSPRAPGFAYFNTSIDNPPWTPGNRVRLRAEGGPDRPAFALDAVAPDALDLGPSLWTVVQGEPLVVTWTPSAGPTEVFLRLRIDQHGTTPSTLECHFPDAPGRGEVPSSLLGSLVSLGLTGFPAGELIRRTVDRATVEPGACVEFVAASSRVPDIVIEGYTPCRADAQCPPGQTCNEVLERCE